MNIKLNIKVNSENINFFIDTVLPSIEYREQMRKMLTKAKERLQCGKSQ